MTPGGLRKRGRKGEGEKKGGNVAVLIVGPGQSGRNSFPCRSDELTLVIQRAEMPDRSHHVGEPLARAARVLGRFGQKPFGRQDERKLTAESTARPLAATKQTLTGFLTEPQRHGDRFKALHG